MSDKKNVYILLIILIVISIVPYINSEEDTSKDRFTALNALIETVYYTQYGMIVEFLSEGKIRQLYIPNRFFDEQLAIRFTEGTEAYAPQLSVIYRNLEPFRIKLYLPKVPYGPKYVTLEYPSDEIINKFKNTEKIEVSFWDKKDSASK